MRTIHLLLVSGALGGLLMRAAETVPGGAKIDYERPSLLTGTIQDLPPARSGVRFTFKREAKREGNSIQVLREYRTPSGDLMATERVRYRGEDLVAFELDDRQTGATGRVDVAPVPGGSLRLTFEYRREPGARTERRVEQSTGPVLINDMIAPFVEAHWGDLKAGKPVPFRFVALDRLETVGFKLVKEREETADSRPITILRMKPTSPVISLLVDPLFFTVEPGDRPRILRYSGRTTPKTGRAGAWKDYDALTIFDWKGARTGE